MTIAPLNFTPQTALSAVDFSPLARLGQTFNAPRSDTTLANLASQYPSGNSPNPSASSGDNVQSWYDFARRPVDQGGLGLSHEQAVGKVANLQAESGAGIPAWGPTGDSGTAHGAAQWRQDRFANLQQFASSRGLDYRDTATQQAFMRHEYLGSPSEGAGGSSERRAYDLLTASRTPQDAASAINRYYERSADTTGGREAAAARLANQLRWSGDY